MRWSAALWAIPLLASLAGAGEAVAEGRISVVHVPGLRLAVVAGPRFNPVVDRLEPFRKRLGEELGVGVTLVPVKDELALADALARKRADYGIFTATGYALAARMCGCVEPLAVPRSIDGSATWRSILLTRGEATAAKVEDLRGRSVAAADVKSVGGRLLPFALLTEQGLAPESFFSRVVTAEGPEAAVRLLMAGKVDAAFAWSTLEGEPNEGYGRGTLRDLVARRQIAIKDVHIAWESPPVPHGPHAVSKDLDAERKARLAEILLRLKDDDPAAYEAVEPEFGGGFVRVAPGAFDVLMPLFGHKARAAQPAEAAGKPKG